MKTETQAILTLIDKPYDEYNAILPLIKQKLGYERIPAFEATLVEELPLTTARRAYRAAIMVAMGEDKVYREINHQRPVQHEKRKSLKADIDRGMADVTAGRTVKFERGKKK
jgi:hypothetical protein